MDRNMYIPPMVSNQWPEHYPLRLPDGCVLALDFAEPAGSKNIDHSSRANHSTATGAALVGAPFGYARLFDGVDDVIVCAAASSLDLTIQGTIEAWVKPNRSYPSDDGTSRYRAIACKSAGGTAAQMGYLLDWYGTNVARSLRLAISDGTTMKSVYATSADFGGVWKHIIGTWDSSSFRLYVNGQSACAPVVNTISGAQAVSAQPLHIGRNFLSATPSYTWDGFIGWLGLYNRALTPSETLIRFRTYAWRFGVSA